VEVRHDESNSLLGYMSRHTLRFVVTLLCILGIPLLTTLWFCNKLRVASMMHTSSWNDNYRAMPSRFGQTPRSSSVTARSRQHSGGPSSASPPQVNGLHPLMVLVYWYHCDVVWINLVNLLFVQLILNNIEHYQQWYVEHRSRTAIHFSP